MFGKVEHRGVSKAGGWIDYSSLDIALRDDLDPKAARAMAVLDPLKLVLTNWDTVMGQGVMFDLRNEMYEKLLRQSLRFLRPCLGQHAEPSLLVQVLLEWDAGRLRIECHAPARVEPEQWPMPACCLPRSE